MPDVTPGRSRLRWYPDDRSGSSADDPGALALIEHAVDARSFNCPLPSLGGDFSRERWQVEAGPAATPARGERHGWQYVAYPRLAFAALHIDDGDGADPAAIQRAAFDAYARLFKLQAELGLSHVQRIWHWLSDVTAGADDDQRYQRFCRGRAEALDAHAQAMPTLPPATLVAGHRRGVRLHALLGDCPVEPIENPRQVSAYHYPRDYGLRAPAFARAGRVRLGGSDYLLISGTASIVGHETRHAGDVAAQAEEALNNVTVLVEAGSASAELAGLQCLKAYIRRPEDADRVEAIARARAPGVPLALLHASLCRDDLLVEFEAQMPLD